MKILIYMGIIFTLSFSVISDSNGQDCKKFHLYSYCMQYPGPNYKMEGQSRSNIIGLGDKLIYSVVFYGGRHYELYFCASTEFAPIHYILRDADTNELIYDNKKDDFVETIGLDIENTRRIKVEVSVLGTAGNRETVENYLGCLGFMMQYKKAS
ncbi:MAG: hypothetical protein K9H49_08780 [Bacteroidales bacterium]|nr:hypothetical protein [Bacteroidales bacterium]MCF8389524.1 hypothetical protein [Bacteroidales bacterium]